MEATEMFLIRHKRLHAHVERLTEGLSAAEVRERIHLLANPLAWLLWHMARTEDSAVNLLICDQPQVLADGWADRLTVGRRDAGTGMTMAEVIDLSTKVHLPALVEYWRAVGERTESLVSSLRPSDLDEVVNQQCVDRFVEQVVEGPTAESLKALMRGTSRGHFLVWLPLTHNYEHVGQADLIRGLLGRPGRF